MSKKKKGGNSIRATKFPGQMITPLASHKRRGKTILSSYHRMEESMSLSSWKDVGIPNVMWLIVLASELKREEYISLFRNIAELSSKLQEPYCNYPLVHNYIEFLRYEDFCSVFEPIAERPELLDAMTILRFFDILPDFQHWDKFLPKKMPTDTFYRLASAVSHVLFHQSERSTDIRWFKVFQKIVTNRIKFPSNMEGVIRGIVKFPHWGDMRSVRPSIRSLEIGFRASEEEFSLPNEMIAPLVDRATKATFLAESFWRVCKERTKCFPLNLKWPFPQNVMELKGNLVRLYREVEKHFFETDVSTGIDPRHDATFGFALYAIDLVRQSCEGSVHSQALGRIALRALVEIAITLEYLSKKADDSLWTQYRNYGYGQAKLSFLKMIEEEELPDFIKIEDLQELANEDTWMEYQKIELGAWSGNNLRSMAEFSGSKDLYDRYYSWTSASVHGQWGAIREQSYTPCLNPLHRLHRVPRENGRVPSVLMDACKILNRILEKVNEGYPSFKPRVDWHKTQA
ncbi:MAG: DUF5677 domain-containing protein [Alphaproteobacteria bacterium]